MHLEGISKRAESANSMRKTSISETPQLRNCSRNHNQDGGDLWAQLQMDSQNIPISASPSVFRAQASTPEARSFYRPLSAAGLHQRSNSFTNVNKHFTQARTMTPGIGPNLARPASRTASRGRQPGPQALFSSPPERASSRDSSRNDRLHTRVSRSRRESSGRASGHASRSGRRSSNQNMADFQRVESVVHPNCPVHGRRSTSASDSARNFHLEHAHHGSTSLRGDFRPQSTGGEADQMSRSELRLLTEPDMDESQSGSECSSLAGTLQSLSSSGRSPPTPSNFDPPTPKAMSFSVEDLGLAPLAIR